MLLHVDARYLSPYAMSAFVALREKGLAFDLATVDLDAGRQHEAAFTRTSLTARVPVLSDGDFSLSESSAIAEYLDETYPGPRLYPVAARERARARQIQAWLRSDLTPLRQERTTEVLFLRPTQAPLSVAAQAAARRLQDAALTLLGDGRDHLFGAWCIADLDLGLMLNRLALNGDPLPPPLAAYAARQWSRPSARGWVELARPATG